MLRFMAADAAKGIKLLGDLWPGTAPLGEYGKNVDNNVRLSWPLALRLRGASFLVFAVRVTFLSVVSNGFQTWPP
jgi:hypothetical protein